MVDPQIFEVLESDQKLVDVVLDFLDAEGVEERLRL
jgi:hypothetical protein